MDKTTLRKYTLFMVLSFLMASALFAFNPHHTPQAIQPPTDTIVNPGDFILPSDTLVSPQALPEGTDTLVIPPAAPRTPPAPERPELNVPGKPVIDKDAPASVVPWYSAEQLQNPFTMSPNFVDTTLLGLQLFDLINDDTWFHAHKGNIGHIYRPLQFNIDLSPGIHLREYDYLKGYTLNHDDLRYYRPRHVFTEMFYILGREREQLFHGKHAQKFHETFHATLQYRVISSPGLGSRIGTTNSNFSLTADYLSPDNRYQALASVIFNNIRNMESGGLINPAAYEQDQNRDSVFFYRAESQLRDFSVNLSHFYQTGFYTPANDDGESRFVNLGRFNHDFSLKRSSFLFRDEAPPLQIFNYPFMDPAKTNDSTVVYKLSNTASWSNFPLNSGRGTFPFNFKLYISHSLNSILQTIERPRGAPETDDENKRIYYHNRDNFGEVVQGVELFSDQSRFLSFGGYANVTLGGYHDEDLHSAAWLNFGRPDRNYTLRMQLRYSHTEAPYFYSRMSVNNIRWFNDFDKMNIINLGARLQFPLLTLEGNYFLLDRMVYLGQNAMPVQNASELGLFSLAASSDINLGPVGFRNHVLFQKPTSDNFERFPDIISYHSAFVNFGLFERSLVNQVGIDFHFNTGYRAMAYMPMVRGFYIQDEHTLSNKYLVDVFWNGKISNARIFFKYQNILGLLIKNNIHYDIPFYPLPQNMLKFGVSWMFFN
jgi:hypothetical protein